MKQRSDAAGASTAAARQDATIADLRATNQHLIKVMSVADGYNAHVRGIVTFGRELPRLRVEEALRNRLGVYRGRIDYGAHPVVFRYVNAARLDSSTPLMSSWPALNPAERARSSYFDIRCANLKILSDSECGRADSHRRAV